MGHCSINMLPWSSANLLHGNPERTCRPSTFWLIRNFTRPKMNNYNYYYYYYYYYYNNNYNYNYNLLHRNPEWTCKPSTFWLIRYFTWPTMNNNNYNYYNKYNNTEEEEKQRVGQKSKPDRFCNNFVYSQPIFIILAQIHYKKFATGRCIVSPPNMICVTALPCKILITTLPLGLYMYTTINNKKYEKICTFYKNHVKKRHNTAKGTLLKWCPWSFRICCCINAHCCHELFETKVYVSYIVRCHSNNHPTARAYHHLKIPL